MKKLWKVKNLAADQWPVLPGIPNLVLKLLGLRGLFREEAISEFLNPDYAKLHDPFLFKDMAKAVERIRRAIEKKEKITIYADYDADAITAAAVLWLSFKKLGVIADYYIPDRFVEGYGINLDAVKAIANNGTKLIITVDCGINAVDEANVCRTLGVDLIITDHHELTGELPKALAIINPKNPFDKYPFGYLTGVGVAFKLVQALFQVSSLKIQGTEKWLLDLVALGTVADCQNLTGENRILVSFGLKVLQKTKHLGLKALLHTAGLKLNKYDTFTLGFILAPRINAAGRIKHADTAFKLLISEDAVEAEKLAEELNTLNKHRQLLTEQITSEARSQLELQTNKKVMLAHGADWPKGIVGLVAGRLAEEYSRPVLVLSTTDGISTGSARAPLGFNMVEALKSVKDLLQKFGGHAQAAGFTLEAKNISDLHGKLLEFAAASDLVLEPILEIDAEVAFDDLTWDNLEYLEKLAPFGFGNPKPKLMARDFGLLDYRLVGATNQHLKMRLQTGGQILEAIAFGQPFLANNLLTGGKIDAIFELTSNKWNGNMEMQLKIIDLRSN